MDDDRTKTESARISELLDTRDRIQGWIDRLDETTADASPRVMDRVRGDYDHRLRTLMAELAGHAEALRARHQAALSQLSEAEAVLERAREDREEVALRYRIGEFDEEEWSARRAELDGAVDEAVETREAARARAAELEEILQQLESPVSRPPQATTTAATASADPEFEDDVTQEAPADGSDFLAQLDRAIESAGADEEEGNDDLDAPSRPGLKCPECGYTNDAEAWYCGVCGVDLA